MRSPKPKIVATTPCQIPHELRYLWEKARKCQSVEEFTKAVAIERTMMQIRQVKRGLGFADGVIGGISQTAFSSEETRQQLEDVVTKSGYSSLKDFYTEATK